MNRLIFYGTSDSQGVPRMLCSCNVCLSKNRTNNRTRPSVSFNLEEVHFQIDTSPDFKYQFKTYNDDKVPDYLLFTHAHNDHLAGFGDFADLCFRSDNECKVIAPAEVMEIIKGRYPYLLKRKGLIFKATNELNLNGNIISFHKVNHGYNGYSYGIKIKQNNGKTWAYVSDAFHVTNKQKSPFMDLNLLILGTTFWEEKKQIELRSVYDVQEALNLIRELNSQSTIFTHLSHDIDIPNRQSKLPENVRFAYDGMEVHLPVSD
ncbi:MBL fold metallo-hydrolase [Metabacillus arenae]|uniref:MBL fold metallo-hydrolase n=1 Tax=Metabacillus arenae TaxID=2771434 RepID=A0A926NIA0_9BACI|nr:MBL fold metallo-hydrolase [Metabacillus arenae]MBD1382194.1 MBL fold metallo-hydrolase [Metabacillus arenae]